MTTVLNSGVADVNRPSALVVLHIKRQSGKISPLLIKDLYSEEMAGNYNNEFSWVIKLTSVVTKM